MHGEPRTSADGTRSRPCPSTARFAWRVTDSCESARHEAQELSKLAVDEKLKVLRITACENSRRTPRRLVRRVDRLSFRGPFPQGHPSVQLCLRPSIFAVPTDTTLGEPFCHFSCPKAPLRKAHFWVFEFLRYRDRSSRSRTLPRTLQCMHTLWNANQTFFILCLAKTSPPPPFVGNTDLKKMRKFIYTYVYVRPLSFFFLLFEKAERESGEEESGGERRLWAEPPTRKVFVGFCQTWTKWYLVTSQARVKRKDSTAVYPANALDSCLQGD